MAIIQFEVLVIALPMVSILRDGKAALQNMS